MSSQLPFGLTLLLLLAGAAQAEVQVWVEPRLADELDPITLTLRATDADIGDEPDLSVLQDDFEVLNQQRISRSQIINGRSSSWVEFQFTLHPKRAGELIIPPIRVGAEQSPETRVIVRALDARVKQTIERMVFFETELSVNPVYVQAQTVFVRRLYYASGVQLYSDLPSTPAVADAVIVPLGDPRSFTTVRSGTRYGVIEQRYAIFPEAPGVLTIPDAAMVSTPGW